MEIFSENAGQNTKVVDQVITLLQKHNINTVLLKGELGAGKTTFTAEMAKNLGFTNQVSSPTFVIEKIYKNSVSPANNKVHFNEIHHIDLYRLTNKKEVLDTGIFDQKENQNHLYIIEWPEIIEDIFKDFIEIKITVNNNSRIFKISATKNQ